MRRRLSAGTAAVGLVAGLGAVVAPSASAADPVLLSEDFEDGSFAPLAQNGGAALSVVDADGDKALLVQGRTTDYDGIKTPADLLQPGGTYTFSMQVKLPAGTAASEARFVVEPAYTWVGNTAVTADAWTTVTGTYNAPAGASAADLRVFIGTKDLGATYDYLVDDLVITGTAGSTTPPTTPAPTTPAAPLTTGFEDGTGGFAPRGDGVSVTRSTATARTGSASLEVTGRTQPWHGATVDVTSSLQVGQAVEVSVWAKLLPGQTPKSLSVSVQRDTGGASAYEGVAGAGAEVTADGWTRLRGTYTLGARADRAQIYVEGAVGASFALDDFSVRPIVQTPVQTDIPGLEDVLGAAGIEHVGVAVDARETVGRAADLVRRHFNAFTPENAGKPESVQPREGEFSFAQLDQLLDFADANGIDVYGHVLVWHSQTPAWFFQDRGRDLTSSPADRALLRTRLEAHIKGIADHIDARYPDGDSPIWAMDVVNEVIADGDTAAPHDMRDSRWYQVLGETFVDDAFRLADRYFPDTKLFINDYNTEMPEKRADYLSLVRALKARGVPVDGVGHQAHVDVARPVQWLRDSIRAVERVDPSLLQAITELDVNASTENPGADVSAGNLPPYSPAFEDPADAGVDVGYYYRDLFAMLRQHSKSVDSVTFWGVSNARSWLRTWPTARPWEQPLPFDDDLQAASAYWGVVDPSRLPTRPKDVLPPRIADVSTLRAVASGPRGEKVDYTLPSTIDTRDGVVPVDCDPAPWSRFPIGTTTVTCTATDAAGNTRTSTFDVVVTRKRDSRP